VSQDLADGRPLFRTTIFGIPIHLDLSFVVVIGLLGLYPGVTALRVVLWLMIAPLAILIHELGHAALARAAGASPSIALIGFGGLTRFTPPRPLSRGWSVAISLAGPLVGLIVGAVLLEVTALIGPGLTATDPAAIALELGIFTSIAWSVLNLLPILPLDGGQILRDLLPGDPPVRQRRAAMVSIVAGSLAMVVAWLYLGSVFLAIFMGFFVLTNVLTVRESAPSRSRKAEPTPEQVVLGLLWQGRADQARQVLQAEEGRRPTDLAVHGAVLALTGEPEQGRALLDQEISRRPDDPDTVAILALTLALQHDWDSLVDVMDGPRGSTIPAPVIDRVTREADDVGRPDVANRIRSITGDAPA
jgi:Zn-dependent protease